MKNKKKKSIFNKRIGIIASVVATVLAIFEIAPKIHEMTSKITVSNLQTEDLSSAGIYLTPEDACITTHDDSKICKKGAMLHTLIKNPKSSNETIKECNLVVTEINKLEESNVVYFPVTFEDSIGVYAVNSGNINSDEYSIKFMLTFDDTFADSNSNIEYKTEDSVAINLLPGEAKEVCNYTFDELDKVFAGRQLNMGWGHIIANINDEEIFVGNIAKTGDGYASFINQGGEGPYKAIPIYLKCEDTDNPEIKNNFPDLPNNSTTPVDFLLLPDESVEVRFYFDITFSNGDQAKSPVETVKICVPIYEDEYDYGKLVEYISKSGSKRLVYNRDDFMDSSFIYNPEKLYSQYLEEN